MGVVGGAVLPPIQGAIAEHHNTRVSFWIALPLFIEICAFGVWQWKRTGWKLGVPKEVIIEVREEESGYDSPMGDGGDDEKKQVVLIEETVTLPDLAQVERIKY